MDHAPGGFAGLLVMPHHSYSNLEVWRMVPLYLMNFGFNVWLELSKIAKGMVLEVKEPLHSNLCG